MKISTGNYEDTHGKKPKGDGTWVFTFRRGHAFTSETAPNWARKFADAKKWAKQTAKSIGGIEEIFVEA